MNKLMTAAALSMSAGLAMAQSQAAETKDSGDCQTQCQSQCEVVVEAVTEVPRPEVVAVTELFRPAAVTSFGVMQPEVKTQSRTIMVQRDDDDEIKVEIVDGDVQAWVNGDRVSKNRVKSGDGHIKVLSKDGDVIAEFQYQPNVRLGIRDDGDRRVFARINGGEQDGNIVWETDDGQVWTTAPGDGQNQFFTQPEMNNPPVMIGINMGSIEGSDVDDSVFDMLEQNDIDEDDAIVILSVIEGLPADKAGLREGDVIVRIGDHEGVSASDLRELLGDMEPGDEIEVGFIRNGRLREKTIELAAWDSEALGMSSPSIQYFQTDEGENPFTFQWRGGEEDEDVRRQLHEHLLELGEGNEDLAVELRALVEKMHQGQGRMQLDLMPRIERFAPRGGDERLLVRPAPRLTPRSDSGLEGRLDRLEDRLDSLEGRIDRLLEALENRERRDR